MANPKNPNFLVVGRRLQNVTRAVDYVVNSLSTLVDPTAPSTVLVDSMERLVNVKTIISRIELEIAQVATQYSQEYAKMVENMQEAVKTTKIAKDRCNNNFPINKHIGGPETFLSETFVSDMREGFAIQQTTFPGMGTYNSRTTVNTLDSTDYDRLYSINLYWNKRYAYMNGVLGLYCIIMIVIIGITLLARFDIIPDPAFKVSISLLFAGSLVYGFFIYTDLYNRSKNVFDDYLWKSDISSVTGSGGIAADVH